MNEIEKHSASIDAFFDKYLQEQFSAKDYKLLKGAYWNQELINEELEIIRPDKNDSHESEIDSIQIIESVHRVDTAQWYDQFFNKS